MSNHVNEDMKNRIDEAAKVLSKNWLNMHTNEALGYQRMLATALAEAGLLATIPEYAEGWDEEENEPEHWPVPVKDCTACEDATPNYRRWTTPWEAIK